MTKAHMLTRRSQIWVLGAAAIKGGSCTTCGLHTRASGQEIVRIRWFVVHLLALEKVARPLVLTATGIKECLDSSANVSSEHGT
jgi:hypothetical protein